jgi:hypothetical protein
MAYCKCRLGIKALFTNRLRAYQNPALCCNSIGKGVVEQMPDRAAVRAVEVGALADREGRYVALQRVAVIKRLSGKSRNTILVLARLAIEVDRTYA